MIKTKFQSVRMLVLKLNYTKNGPKTLIDWFKVIWDYDIFIQDKIPFMKSVVLANIIIWLFI